MHVQVMNTNLPSTLAVGLVGYIPYIAVPEGYQPIRLTAQRAVASLQMILIAVRGHRAYTSHELDLIFRGVGRQFFMALEELAQWHEEKSHMRQSELYRQDPEKHATPVRFQRTVRFVYVV